MKKALSLLLTAMMLVGLLAACSNSNDTQAAEETGGADSTTAADKTEEEAEPVVNDGDATVVSLMGWYDEPNMEGIINALNEKLGGEYVVEYTFVNLQQYNDVLSTQLAAGEGPDILADGASFPARIRAGNLVEITGEAYLDNFNEVGMSLCAIDGAVYGIPSYGWYSGLWFNKDIFEENDVAVPTTFDELIEACDQLSAAGVQPLGFGLSDGDTAWHSLVGYLENDFYHGDGPGTEFDTRFAFGETTMAGNMDSALNRWYELIEKGYINSTMVGISNEQALNDFIAGKTAMFNGGNWQYDQLQEAGFAFGMLPHMGSSNEYYLVGGPAVSYGINANSQNQEAAAKVLAAMASEEVQQATLDANKGAFGYYMGLTPEIPDEYELIVDTLSNGNVGVCWDRWGVNMPAQSLVNEAVKQLQGMVAGTTSPEDFLQALDAKADSIRYDE